MKTKPGLFSIILWLAWLLVLATPSAHGAATVSTPHATVTLLSERPQATPGQTLWLGLRFELIPHWHVYWRNPGASGAAPVIRWILPEGWTAGDLHWPVPQRIPVGPLTNYGYEDTVMFVVPVRLPEGPLPAGPLTLTADAEWLVCQVECIPESGRFTVELPHPGSPTVEDPATQRRFAAARAQWPEADRVAGRYRLAGDARTITLEVPGLAVDDRAEVWFAAYAWGPVIPAARKAGKPPPPVWRSAYPPAICPHRRCPAGRAGGGGNAGRRRAGAPGLSGAAGSAAGGDRGQRNPGLDDGAGLCLAGRPYPERDAVRSARARHQGAGLRPRSRGESPASGRARPELWRGHSAQFPGPGGGPAAVAGGRRFAGLGFQLQSPSWSRCWPISCCWWASTCPGCSPWARG